MALKELGLDKECKITFRKFDFKAAYRQVPLDPLSSLKHAHKVRSGATVYDRFVSFGMKNSGNMWALIVGLVGCIAVTLCRLLCLLVYVDDVYGVEIVAIDHPDDRPTPGLIRLKELCDFIGVEYSPQKALSGPDLDILGFLCRAADRSFSLTTSRREELIAELAEWIASARKCQGRQVKQFLSIAGWLNWASAVAPPIRPFVRSLYGRVAGHPKFKTLKIGLVVRRDLEWIQKFVTVWDGKRALRDTTWLPSDADFVQFADAASDKKGKAGIGVYWPQGDVGRYLDVDSYADISQMELWAQVAGIEQALSEKRIGRHDKIVIWTDNEGVADALAKRSGVHNDSMRRLVHLEWTHGLSIHANWIRGECNTRADELSRGRRRERDQRLTPTRALLQAAQRDDGTNREHDADLAPLDELKPRKDPTPHEEKDTIPMVPPQRAALMRAGTPSWSGKGSFTQERVRFGIEGVKA
jgi:ribonuclease HI